jgi:radical SAM protein with 4Fe4S-binding SPASM domain
MSLETMERIVVQSKKFAPYRLMLFVSQGEPLINRALPQMIELASKAGIAERIEVISNGSMLTGEMSDRLIASGLTNLRISLQGMDADSYFKMCGVKIDFSRFVNQLEYFYKHKKSNMGLFVKIMDAALPAGGEHMFYKMFDGICDRMSVEFVQPVYHAVAVPKSGPLRDRYGAEHAPRFVCPFPFYSLAVWPDGEVQPCDAIYRAARLGNVHDSTLYEIWNGGDLRQFRKTQLIAGYKQCGRCEECCAPDDCSNPADVIDGDRERLLQQQITLL